MVYYPVPWLSVNLCARRENEGELSTIVPLTIYYRLVKAPLSFLMRIFSFSIPRAVFQQQSRGGLTPVLEDNAGNGRHSSFCLCRMDDVSGKIHFLGACQMMVGAMEMPLPCGGREAVSSLFPNPIQREHELNVEFYSVQLQLKKYIYIFIKINLIISIVTGSEYIYIKKDSTFLSNIEEHKKRIKLHNTSHSHVMQRNHKKNRSAALDGEPSDFV
ncbi:hypothetical protein HELRODRAFT_189815 [Helobdella robusta]|uniref:Uncharacterized protein n=1 Tax=Helobdella robusta TaxID=6412 RepID=T1FRE1_HELRO|nr:hypothetical protein HELRODRAFT_189815 [Helobdella robusta]ESN91793.1 hypothetical protein HELRODRAFT_189815 [Helobdella robusta]